jgi:hypothetical protein
VHFGKRIVAGKRRTHRLEWEEVHLRHAPDSIFLQSHKAITKQVPTLQKITTASSQIQHHVELSSLRQYDINYDRESLAFNQAYFFRNLYKCLSLLVWSRQETALTNVVDLASGAGPFALAARLIDGDRFHRTMLVDKSSAQLSLARRVFAAMGVPITDVENTSLLHFIPPPDLYRLCSYWLCESDCYRQFSRWHSHALLQPGALFIDYREVLEEFASLLEISLFCYRLISINVKPSYEVASQLEKEYVSVYGLRVSRRHSC